MALNKDDMNMLSKAEAVFLIETGYKTYALRIKNENEKPRVLRFTRGVVFAYKPSYFCWQEDSKYKLKIVDLVRAYNSCPRKTYRSANRAKKKINYFKL